jgi:hypothetical protein
MHAVASPHSRPSTSCNDWEVSVPRGSATPSQRVMLPQRDDSTRRRTPQSTREEEREQTNCCTRTSARAKQRRSSSLSSGGARMACVLYGKYSLSSTTLLLEVLYYFGFARRLGRRPRRSKRVSASGLEMLVHSAHVVMLPAANSSCGDDVGARRSTRRWRCGGGVVALWSFENRMQTVAQNAACRPSHRAAPGTASVYFFAGPAFGSGS